MAKRYDDRRHEKRLERLAKMQAQIEAGLLTVRQMTPEESRRWEEHSVESSRTLLPERRARREAALEKRRRIQEKWRAEPGTPDQPGDKCGAELNTDQRRAPA
jgi:hypothetical protein